MNRNDKARQLFEHLQVVLDEAQAIDKRDASTRAMLSPQEVRVLRAVERQDRCIMSAIADAICLSLSSCTGLIDRLVAKKLVRRDRSGDDRRVVEVELTDEGREAHKAAMQAPVAFARDLLKGLNEEEQQALVGLFSKIAARIETEKRTA